MVRRVQAPMPCKAHHQVAYQKQERGFGIYFTMDEEKTKRLA
jgi:hypothetical protein